MRKILILNTILVVLFAFSCTNNKSIKEDLLTKQTSFLHAKKIDKNLPTVGILIFEGVIINEVVAPLDVFSNNSEDNKALFNVITIATDDKTYNTAHGLKIKPDFTVDSLPLLKVLVVPSSYNTDKQISDSRIVEFIKEQNKTTDYIASHCGGAFILAATGIVDNRNIVTYCSGGDILQKKYPKLKVADENEVFVIQDGKFISSNGNLVSYIASFDLLEKLTSTKHRKFTEKAILFDRLNK